jgi:hypothetical protein
MKDAEVERRRPLAIGKGEWRGMAGMSDEQVRDFCKRIFLWPNVEIAHSLPGAPNLKITLVRPA